MSGKVESPKAANDVIYEKNMLYAVDKCQKENITVVIEPINNYTVPNYYMNNFVKGPKNTYHALNDLLDIIYILFYNNTIDNTL